MINIDIWEKLAQDAIDVAARATRRPWRWWTSNSFRRLSSDASGKDGDVAYAVRRHDGCMDISIRREDMDLIERACNEYVVLATALIEAAAAIRLLRAQAERRIGESLQMRGRDMLESDDPEERARGQAYMTAGREALDGEHRGTE
jgi:hypothetical protein